MARDSLPAKPLLCHDCLVRGIARSAWTIGEGKAMCVRCAVEGHSEDDMDQHDLAVEVYESLRKQGHPNAY